MAKRSNGEGSIFKRADGRWCATYYIGSKRKFLYGKTQKEAKDKLKKLIEDAEAKADLVLSESSVLEAWVLEFLEQYKANDLKATTFTTYMTFYRKHIKGSMLGKMALQDITTMELQKYYNGKITDGLSAKTVRHLSVIIREALSQAVLLRYIKNNPHEGIVLPKKEKFVGKVLSKEDVIKLINEAKEERLYPLIMTTIMIGMRKGEVLGLTWKNVDLEQGYIKVEKSLCRVSGGRDDKGRERTKVVLLDPKNKTSKRTIPISTQLIDILKVHKENQDKAKNENKDIYNDELELVFANKLGGFMSDRNVLQEFYNVLDKYEIPRVRFHDLRHTYASLLMESETDSKVIQELLGHSSISTTLDIYTHLKLEQKRNSVDKMAELFSENAQK